MSSPTVVLLPMWAPGHFMPMLEAGKRLLGGSGGDFSLTVLVMQPPMASSASEVTTQIRRAAASCHGINFHHLPAVEHPTDHPVDPSDYIQLYAQHVKVTISGLATPVAAIVVDLFGTALLDVAHDLAVAAYVYFSSTGAMLSLMLRLPALHEEVDVKLKEMEGEVDVPGMPPVPVASLPSPQLNNYTWYAYHGRRYVEAKGIIINTVAELEQGVLTAIADGRCMPGHHTPTVYPIGPLLPFKPHAEAERPHECVRWLDSQPPASVVFLCFGSRGWFDAAQAHEVATGLERSGQRFLWVLRGPPAGGSWYPVDGNVHELLPGGFLERTKGTGLVWPRWAPQTEILAHAAVGGFVTHSGWNSVLESLWFGVPMVPWPLSAEQPLNAFQLVAVMGVAVALKIVCRGTDSFVEAAELERAVSSLVDGSEEGRRAREKALEMKAACRKAVEVGGSSHAALQKLARTYPSSAYLDRKGLNLILSD